ncbi:MAG: hypothetical protein KAG66_14260 [Methylococcales bacterium]|nr:hypothetical protein [Methylococcales bacterium]
MQLDTSNLTESPELSMDVIGILDKVHAQTEALVTEDTLRALRKAFKEAKTADVQTEAVRAGILDIVALIQEAGINNFDSSEVANIVSSRLIKDGKLSKETRKFLKVLNADLVKLSWDMAIVQGSTEQSSTNSKDTTVEDSSAILRDEKKAANEATKLADIELKRCD